MDDQFVIALCYDKKMEYCSVVNSYFLCEGEYILRVISKDEAIILWEKLNNEFKFKPGTDITGEWIIIPGDTKKYNKATPWSEKQEKIINSI